MPSMFLYGATHVYQYARCTTRVFASSPYARVKRVPIPPSVGQSPARPDGGFTRPFDAGHASSVIQTGLLPSPCFLSTARKTLAAVTTRPAEPVYGCSAATSNSPLTPPFL